MDPAAAAYIQAIAPQHRALFDRVHRLILHRYPEVTVGLSYAMPTYRVDDRSLIIGVWKHGLSWYAMEVAEVADIIDRHGLHTSKGTIHLGSDHADAMTDDEIGALVQVALGAPPGPGQPA